MREGFHGRKRWPSIKDENIIVDRWEPGGMTENSGIRCQGLRSGRETEKQKE